MNHPAATNFENRVLVLAPVGADARNIRDVLGGAGWRR